MRKRYRFARRRGGRKKISLTHVKKSGIGAASESLFVFYKWEEKRKGRLLSNTKKKKKKKKKNLFSARKNQPRLSRHLGEKKEKKKCIPSRRLWGRKSKRSTLRETRREAAPAIFLVVKGKKGVFAAYDPGGGGGWVFNASSEEEKIIICT